MSPHAPELYPQPRRRIAGSVPMVPPKTGHHAKKIVRAGKFLRLGDTDRLMDARAIWFAALERFRPQTPLEGPLALSITLTWPWREKDKKTIRAGGGIPSEVKPDCDNVAKTITDVMVTLGMLRQDQQIADLHVAKRIGDNAGIVFSLEQMQP